MFVDLLVQVDGDDDLEQAKAAGSDDEEKSFVAHVPVPSQKDVSL